jgi:hypothetical protein
LGEVLASQRVMLANLDKTGARLPQDKLEQSWRGQIQGLKRLLGAHGSVCTLWVDQAEVIADPRRTARRVALFLGDLGERQMDPNAMAAVVDARLQRQHKGGCGSLARRAGGQAGKPVIPEQG